MPQLRRSEPQLAELREVAPTWGQIISTRAFGEDGPDLDIDFRAMEEIGAAAARGLVEGAPQQMLARQAQNPPAEQPGPDGGRSGPTAHPLPDRTGGRNRPRRTDRLRSGRPAGLFPLRTAFGRDEHAYRSSVVQKVVTRPPPVAPPPVAPPPPPPPPLAGAFTLTAALLLRTGFAVSVAERVWVPVVLRVTVKLWTPPSAAVNV
ncbi:MAG TPA: hypothetical protein VH092_32995 [Urbifossiella sp.]|nr:hypothetical protein [Urbifossiella sp.]